MYVLQIFLQWQLKRRLPVAGERTKDESAAQSSVEQHPNVRTKDYVDGKEV